VLALEIGDSQADETAKLLKRTGAFASIEIIRDLGNRPRVILGQKE
jgi:methylase of polypeptide subunit release factors